MGPTFPVYPKGFLNKLHPKGKKKLKEAIHAALEADPAFQTMIKAAKGRAKTATMSTYNKLLKIK